MAKELAKPADKRPNPLTKADVDKVRAAAEGEVLDWLQLALLSGLRAFEIAKIRSNYLPRTLVRMRVGGATTGSIGNILRGNLEAAHACRQHGYPGGLGFILGKLARRVPQFFTRPPRT